MQVLAGGVGAEGPDRGLADALGRRAELPALDLPLDYLRGHTILVTGAGGSIGSELCRQLCRYGPKRLVLLGRGENRIHSIYYELTERFPAIAFEPVIANVTSAMSVAGVLLRCRPEAVFHAAAHKHVFLMECNPVEAAWNNVVGTANLAALSDTHRVERFVLISTDKAAEPTSVMGATKALCERLVAYRQTRSVTTRYMTVRFGNVLGSAGSVVPIFRALAEQGKPITVTSPEATRYFMTVEEAAFLVLQAGALGKGGELFVLDMGEPLNIVDLARSILRLHGRDPDAPGAMRFIGLRPGEKLHETLVSPSEELVQTACPLIRQVVTNGPGTAYGDVEECVRNLREAIGQGDEELVLSVLAEATGARLDPAARYLTRAGDATPAAAKLTPDAEF